MEIKIPADVKAMFDHVVKTRFHGNEEEAVIQAIVFFLEKEKESLVDQEKFRLSLQKALEMYTTRTERADSEFGDAFDRLQRRKSKAAKFFDELTKGSED